MSRSLETIQEGDYETLSEFKPTKEEADRYLPDIITTAGLLAFIQRGSHTTYAEKITHQMLVMAMNHLLYLDYEAILVACIRYGMPEIFAVLIDFGIDYRLCADKVLMEIGDKPDDNKVAMFFKFTQERRDFLEAPYAKVPSVDRSRFISYIHGARALGYQQRELRIFWLNNDHTQLLAQAIERKDVRATEYLVFSCLCITDVNRERMMSFAIKSLSLPIISILLKAGISPNVMVGDKHALVYVVMHSNEEVVEAVVQRLSYHNNEHAFDEAIDVAHTKNKETIEALLSRRRDSSRQSGAEEYTFEGGYDEYDE